MESLASASNAPSLAMVRISGIGSILTHDEGLFCTIHLRKFPSVTQVEDFGTVLNVDMSWGVSSRDPSHISREANAQDATDRLCSRLARSRATSMSALVCPRLDEVVGEFTGSLRYSQPSSAACGMKPARDWFSAPHRLVPSREPVGWWGGGERPLPLNPSRPCRSRTSAQDDMSLNVRLLLP